jgi:hypothetical protein
MYYTLMKADPNHYQYVSYAAYDKYPKDVVLISQADYAIAQTGVLETKFIEDESGSAKAAPSDLIVLPTNLKVGTTWHNTQASETDDYTVLGLSTVTTYAGTFHHSLVLLEQTHIMKKNKPVIIDTAIFEAPGIGTVKSEAWGGIPFTVARDAVKISYPLSPPPLTHQAIPLDGSVFPAVMSWQSPSSATTTSPSTTPSPSPSPSPSTSTSTSSTPLPSSPSSVPSSSPSISTKSYGYIDGYSIETPPSTIQTAVDLTAMAQGLQSSWNLGNEPVGWQGSFDTGWQHDGIHLTFTPDAVMVPPTGEYGAPLVDWIVTVNASGTPNAIPPSDGGPLSPAEELTVTLTSVALSLYLDEGEDLRSNSAASNLFDTLGANQGIQVEITLANKQGNFLTVIWNMYNNSYTTMVNQFGGTNANESAWLTQTIKDH